MPFKICNSLFDLTADSHCPKHFRETNVILENDNYLPRQIIHLGVNACKVNTGSTTKDDEFNTICINYQMDDSSSMDIFISTVESCFLEPLREMKTGSRNWGVSRNWG